MNLYHNLHDIQQKILQAEQDSNRIPGSVLLLAVTKQQNSETIKKLVQLGIYDFGESYFQEAQHKINELQSLPICWHFIGPLQTNKSKKIAASFSWVHSVNRITIAEKLNEFRPNNLGPLNVCIQINLIEEKTKSGINPEDAAELALAISKLPNLKLRGLMTIPPPITVPQEQYELFSQLKKLLNVLNQEVRLTMDTLSMGMSDDFIPAIKAGATIVRIGRGIFGERPRPSNTN